MFLEKLVCILLLCIIFLLIFTLIIIFSINIKKGWFALILTLLFTFFAGYYIYITFYEKFISSLSEYENLEKVVIKPDETRNDSNFFLIIEIGKEKIRVSTGDEIEMKKNITFKICDIEGIEKNSAKVNFIGFVGNPKFNDGQDIGYDISYKTLRKDKAFDKKREIYEIEVKKNEKKIGSIFVRFVD